jgi:hypothetical protein
MPKFLAGTFRHKSIFVEMINEEDILCFVPAAAS